MQYDHLDQFNFLICGNQNLFPAYNDDTHLKIKILRFDILGCQIMISRSKVYSRGKQMGLCLWVFDRLFGNHVICKSTLPGTSVIGPLRNALRS